MARVINTTTAVLAGGIQQHVTRSLTEFGQFWLMPLPLAVVCSWGLSLSWHCFFGKLLSTDTGAGCSKQWFSWGKWMIDSSITEKREREGGTAQHPEAGSPSREGGEGERLSFTEERCDFPFSLLNSKTWNTRSAVDLCVYRLLWSGHWNISSCGALGGMLYTEFMNKVRFSSCSSKILKV